MRKNLYLTPQLYEKFESLHDYLCTIEDSHLDENGSEVPNPMPLVIPGFEDSRPLTLHEQIKRLFKTEMSHQAQVQGAESFEEANDFNIPEESLPDTTQYTVMEDENPFIQEPTAPPTNAGGTPPSQETPVPPAPEETPPDPQTSV